MSWQTFKIYFHRLGAPKSFFSLTRNWPIWFGGVFAVLFITGAYLGLVAAPSDYQQGEAYRIMFIHVPAAWLSLMIYSVMTVAAIIALVWRIKTAFLVCLCSAPIGLGFTLIALITGAIWGKPMWGTWWVWDARLTSELILAFIYFGVIALYTAFEHDKVAEKAMAFFTLVGAVNIPVIHYSVVWWNSLHQGPSVFRDGGPAMPMSMLIPLLLIAFAFKFFYGWLLLLRLHNHILQHSHDFTWQQSMLKG